MNIQELSSNSLEQEIATLDPDGTFSGDREEVEQNSGLQGKTYTSSIFATNNHAINDKWSINNSLRYNYVDIRNTDTFNGDDGPTITFVVIMTLIV